MAPTKRKQKVKGRTRAAAPKRTRRTASASTSTRKRTKAKSRSRAKAKTAVARVTTVAPGGATPEDLFTKGLIVRGEALPVDQSGKLPNEATHVVETDERGEMTVRRERFKLY